MTLKERTVEDHNHGGVGGKPVNLGQGYSTLAWISGEFWELGIALPLSHERILTGIHRAQEVGMGILLAQIMQLKFLSEYHRKII